LFGEDKFSGQNYEHRRKWVVERIGFLTSVFAIDVMAYAVMSNHKNFWKIFEQPEAGPKGGAQG